MPKRAVPPVEKARVVDMEDLVKEADPAAKLKHNQYYHDFDVRAAEWVRRELLSWYDKHQRVLPWRTPSKAFMEQNVHGAWKTDSVLAMEGVDRAYAVWISEIMAQQTRVATVIDYYKRWMKKWPTIQSLAKASIEDVNSMWQGLGYYSRARRIHEAAILITKQLGGRLPQTSAEMEQLIPGVGRYTAAAVCSIVHGERVGVVDGNVVRVLARLRSIGGDSKGPAAIDRFWELSNKLVCGERPGDFNQAIMEFGATICTPKNPACDSCPIARQCRAYAETVWTKQASAATATVKKFRVNKSAPTKNRVDGAAEHCLLCTPASNIVPSAAESVLAYPYKAPKKKSREEHVAVSVLTRDAGGERVHLLVQRPDKGLLAGLWEFPNVVVGEGDADETPPATVRQAALDHYLAREFGISVIPVDRQDAGSVTHVFSHILHHYCVERITLPADAAGVVAACTGTTLHEKRAWKWVSARDMKCTWAKERVPNVQETAISTAMRKVLQVADSSDAKPKATKKGASNIDPRQKPITSFFAKK